MRRFENYGAEPREIVELADDASAAAVADLKARGFVEIRRVSAFLDEESVTREQRITWVDGYVTRVMQLAQRDRVVTQSTGTEDVRGSVATVRFAQIAEASVEYERRLTVAKAVAAAAEDRRGAVVVADRASRDLALEARCFAAADDDPEPWRVYADWLIERGDPRGEIAALALGGKPDDALAAIPLFFPGGRARVTLHHGFARTIELAIAELAMLDSPLMHTVEGVHLRLPYGTAADTHDWTAALVALARAPRAIRSLVLSVDGDAFEDTDRDPPTLPSLPWDLLPELEHLHVKRGAGIGAGHLALPNLRTYTRECGALSRPELASILDAEWPGLVELNVWFGTRRGLDRSDLAALLHDRTATPRLGHLGLVASDLDVELIELVATSPLLPQLYSLSLAGGVLASDAATSLAKHASRFRHLAALELSDNYFDEEAIACIRAALDNVLVGDQRESSDGERYVSTSE